MRRLEFFVIFVLFNSVFGQYPNEYPRCNFGDNECITKAINKVLRLAKNGIPSMGVPSFEPLRVDKIDIIQDPTSNIAIKLVLRDADIFGISNANIYKTVGFDEDPFKSKFELHAKLPKLTIISNYIIDGKVLILPIQGSGNSSLSFDDVDLKLKFKLEPHERDGAMYSKISKLRLQIQTSKLSLVLENLFNGNKALGDNMNLFINENWEIIFQELKPSIVSALMNIISGIIDSVFKSVPYKSLFLEK